MTAITLNGNKFWFLFDTMFPTQTSYNNVYQATFCFAHIAPFSRNIR